MNLLAKWWSAAIALLRLKVNAAGRAALRSSLL